MIPQQNQKGKPDANKDDADNSGDGNNDRVDEEETESKVAVKESPLGTPAQSTQKSSQHGKTHNHQDQGQETFPKHQRTYYSKHNTGTWQQYRKKVVFPKWKPS